MAVIQKIRNKYGKLAGGIIALALVGFIFMDAASGRFGDMLGHDSSVMKVNGEKVNQQDYQQRMKEYETLYTMFNKNRTLDDATRAQMNEQAVQLIIYEKVAGEQCDKLGITSTKEEEKELIYGADPDPLVRQFQIQGNPVFVNQQTGQFDPQYVKAFEQQADQIDPTGKARESWEILKGYVIRSHRINKFNSMFMNAVYIPKYLTMRAAADQNKMAGISFVKIPLASVNDNEVKVTDEDLNAYMKKHAGMFTADEPARSIEYVSFDIKPAQEDTARALTTLAQIKNDFAATKDDESFVNSHSEDPYKPVYANKKTFMSREADSIMNLPVDGVYGPYFENNAYKLTKVLEKKDYPDSVKCRHILVRTKNAGKDVLADSLAKKRIDSIATAIKGGANFDSMVVKYSDDDGSKKTGGEYTFVLQQKTTLSKEFADFIFDGKTGESKTVHVSNDNYTGYHYIEILDQKGIQPAIKLTTISKALYAGDNTTNAAYAKATEFAGRNDNAAAFDSSIKKSNLEKKLGENIKVSDFTIQGLGPSREIIRWIYDHKVGDVSQVFTLDGRFVVAKVSAIQEKGLMQLNEGIRAKLESMVKAEKKADLIRSKYKSLNTLDAIAKTANQQVQNADTINLGATYMPGLGYEPKIVGYTFYPGFQLNTVSPGIKGQSDVYFISVKNRWDKPTDPAMVQNMLMQQRSMQQNQMKNAMGQQLQQTIAKEATVKYNASNM